VIRRGDIYVGDLSPTVGREQSGRRPLLVVVVSVDDFHELRYRLAWVVPLTTVKRGYPTHVEVPADRLTGLSDVSYAKVEDLRSVSQERLAQRLGGAPPSVLAQVATIMRRIAGLR
jgi:mRNA interferase MazF